MIDGHTRLAAVVATPIKHSLSPMIHNLAFQLTKTNGVYIAFDISSDDLKETLKNVTRYNMFGLNISMPYKTAVLPYLDEISLIAELTGAVNTVVNRSGKLYGTNTDGIGFFRSLDYLLNFSVSHKRVIILGAGGAALAVIVQAIFDGADSVVVFTRESSLEKTKNTMANLSKSLDYRIKVYSFEKHDILQDYLNKSDLLVNATSLGMDGKSNPLSDDITLSKHILVTDVIYQPFETPLLSFAKNQGCKTLNGLGMLLFQAAESYYLWTDQKMPVNIIWQTLIDYFDKDKRK